MGDALAVAIMNEKRFGKFDFKKFHPSGSLSIKLKSVSDLMAKGNNIPFVSENLKMKDALKTISNKKLGVLIIKNHKGYTTGIITDGQIRRASQKNKDLQSLTVKKVMTPNPISINKDELAAKALSIMNAKKITCLCVNDKKIKNKTIGIIHIHQILKSGIQ